MEGEGYDQHWDEDEWDENPQDEGGGELVLTHVDARERNVDTT